MTAVATRVAIHLEAECVHASCAHLAHRFNDQLGVPKYSEGASVMPMPASFGQWLAEHRTARKRSNRASRLGYVFGEVDNSEHSQDIYEINTSLERRQGRPMSNGYREFRKHGRLPAYPCERHRIHTYGCLHDGRLRAYMTLYRVGELGLVSMILGHGDHLRNDLMYLLASGMVDAQIEQGGILFYNRHDSGTSGLVYYKERVGFHAADIEWVL